MKLFTELSATNNAMESPSPQEFARQAMQVALRFVTIITCVQCKGAVAKGYCCTWCGCTDPRGN